MPAGTRAGNTAGILVEPAMVCREGRRRASGSRRDIHPAGSEWNRPSAGRELGSGGALFPSGSRHLGYSLPEKVAMATLRAQSTSGLLIDALADDAFVRCLLGHIGAQRDQGEADRLIFKRSRSFHPPPGFADDAELRRPNVEQSNTSIMAGAAILEAFRKLEAGIHPEVEIGTFLTDTVRFENVPQLLGTVECVRQGNEPIVLCILQSLIDDSVDGWSVVAKGLRAVTAVAKGKDSAHLLSLAGQLGLRAAQLHRVCRGDGARVRP
jgi:maltose alpha-D-glucosyltransferase/alpha-amylase